jgi:hypothetical protein
MRSFVRHERGHFNRVGMKTMDLDILDFNIFGFSPSPNKVVVLNFPSGLQREMCETKSVIADLVHSPKPTVVGSPRLLMRIPY